MLSYCQPAGAGIECQNAIGKKIVADAVRSIEVEGTGSGRGEDDAKLGIDAESGPGIGAARDLIRIGRPGFVAEFTRVRDGVEDPPLFASVDIEGANVAGRSGQRLRDCARHDDHVLENHSRAGSADADGLRRTVEAEAQVDAAVVAETRDRLTGQPVERVEKSPVCEKKTTALPRVEAVVHDP